jgi:hypothetical protein
MSGTEMSQHIADYMISTAPNCTIVITTHKEPTEEKSAYGKV